MQYVFTYLLFKGKTIQPNIKDNLEVLYKENPITNYSEINIKNI